VDFVYDVALKLPKDSQVFLGLEGSQLRAIKSLLLDTLEFDRINIHATVYWKKGLDADRFGADKKRNPV
jgi:NADPH-dependent ferric siderophore reductase